MWIARRTPTPTFMGRRLERFGGGTRITRRLAMQTRESHNVTLWRNDARLRPLPARRVPQAGDEPVPAGQDLRACRPSHSTHERLFTKHEKPRKAVREQFIRDREFEGRPYDIVGHYTIERLPSHVPQRVNTQLAHPSQNGKGGPVHAGESWGGRAVPPLWDPSPRASYRECHSRRRRGPPAFASACRLAATTAATTDRQKATPHARRDVGRCTVAIDRHRERATERRRRPL